MPRNKKFPTPKTNKSANLLTFLDDAKPIEYSPTADDLRRKLKLVQDFNVLPEQNACPDQFEAAATSQMEMNEAAAKAVSEQFTRERLIGRLERSIYDLEEISKGHTFADRLRYYMQAKGFDREKLASRTGFHKDTISDQLNKGVIPHDGNLAIYAEVFGVKVKDLKG
jgi:hypothetical protein